jgi:hypothetical membrane protein
MKRHIAWILALISGLYLLTVGIFPDPIPFIDEATALLVFVNAMAYLGHDVRKWIPFLGKGKTMKSSASKGAAGQTVDV